MPIAQSKKTKLTSPPAVAATPSTSAPPNCATSSHPAAPADAASGRGYQFRGQAVPGVEPIAGWRLFEFDEEDGDGFTTPSYYAKCEGCDLEIWLDTSRFRFTPSQDRFAYLVNHGFPPRPNPFGGWDDTDIEYAMATASESTVPMVLG